MAYVSSQLPTVEELLESVQPCERQRGAIVAVGSRIVGMEAVEHLETWRRACKRFMPWRY